MVLNQISTKELRNYGLVLGLLLIGLAFLHMRKGHINMCNWLSVSGGVIAFLSVVKTEWIRPIYKGLTPVLLGIGWINTHILLGIVFYLVIAPIGICMKLFGKDLLYRKIEKNARSYWIVRDGKPLDPKHYENQF